MSGKPNPKWMETMIKKHGSREAVIEAMADIGRMAHKRGGGFALMSYEKLAKISAKGGRRSRRKKVVK